MPVSSPLVRDLAAPGVPRRAQPPRATTSRGSACQPHPSAPTPSARTPPRSPIRTRWHDESMTANQATAQDEVAGICRDLIRIDTSTPGDHSGPGERLAAEHVAALLADVGLDPQVLESHPKRASVVARIQGRDPERKQALLIHGHLDVVPASKP